MALLQLHRLDVRGTVQLLARCLFPMKLFLFYFTKLGLLNLGNSLSVHLFHNGTREDFVPWSSTWLRSPKAWIKYDFIVPFCTQCPNLCGGSVKDLSIYPLDAKMRSTSWQLDEIVETINTTSPRILHGRNFVLNFGAGCSHGGRADPTYRLLKQYSNVQGLLIDLQTNPKLFDAYPVRNGVRIQRGFEIKITSIVNLLASENVPKRLLILKIDIDSWECSLLEHLILNGYSSVVIHIEYNVAIPLPFRFQGNATEFESDIYNWRHGSTVFDGSSIFYGCSLSSIADILVPRGYRLLEIDGWDATFVHRHVVQTFEPIPNSLSTSINAGFYRRFNLYPDCFRKNKMLFHEGIHALGAAFHAQLINNNVTAQVEIKNQFSSIVKSLAPQRQTDKASLPFITDAEGPSDVFFKQHNEPQHTSDWDKNTSLFLPSARNSSPAVWGIDNFAVGASAKEMTVTNMNRCLLYPRCLLFSCCSSILQEKVDQHFQNSLYNLSSNELENGRSFDDSMGMHPLVAITITHAILYDGLVKLPPTSPREYERLANRPQLKVINLVQGDIIENLGAFYHSLKPMIFLSFKKRKQGSLFFPNSYFSEGRLALFLAARQLELIQGWLYNYYIFMDDDVEYANGCTVSCMDNFVASLRHWRPAVAAPVYLHNQTKDYVAAVNHFDFIVIAYHREAVEILQPWSLDFDKYCVWASQLLEVVERSLIYRNHMLVFGSLQIRNSKHRNYPKDCMKIGQAFHQLVAYNYESAPSNLKNCAYRNYLDIKIQNVVIGTPRQKDFPYHLIGLNLTFACT